MPAFYAQSIVHFFVSFVVHYRRIGDSAIPDVARGCMISGKTRWIRGHFLDSAVTTSFQVTELWLATNECIASSGISRSTSW